MMTVDAVVAVDTPATSCEPLNEVRGELYRPAEVERLDMVVCSES